MKLTRKIMSLALCLMLVLSLAAPRIRSRTRFSDHPGREGKPHLRSIPDFLR